jgi:hypothetical protein
MEETYIIILIIAILILILYFVNFSGAKSTQRKNDTNRLTGSNPTENFGSCNPQITQAPPTVNGTKATLKVHIAYWCGWSKKLLAQLSSDEFKNKFKDVETICAIEIIDCEANKEKCDPSIVKGFPTIILQTKSGQLKQYTGDRSTDDLISFIKSNQ